MSSPRGRQQDRQGGGRHLHARRLSFTGRALRDNALAYGALGFRLGTIADRETSRWPSSSCWLPLARSLACSGVSEALFSGPWTCVAFRRLEEEAVHERLGVRVQVVAVGRAAKRIPSSRMRSTARPARHRCRTAWLGGRQFAWEAEPRLGRTTGVGKADRLDLAGGGQGPPQTVHLMV